MERKIEQLSEVEKQFEMLVASYGNKLQLIGGIVAVRYTLKKLANGFLRNAKFCVNCVYSRATDKKLPGIGGFAGGYDEYDRACSLGLERDTCGRHTRIPTEDLKQLHDKLVEIEENRTSKHKFKIHL